MSTLRPGIAAMLIVAMAIGSAHGQPAPSPGEGERVLVVGTKQAPPFSMKDQDGHWTGMSIELWRRIAEQLHLRYQLREATLQGLIAGTASGSLDAAVAALTVTAAREQLVDFTQPFFATGLGIAVPRDAKFDWWQLMRSLISFGFFQALLALVGVTFLVGFIVWLIERRHTKHFSHDRHGFMSSIWWSALIMTQAGPDQEPMTALGRGIAVAWMATSVIIVAVFTAGVTSQLTTKQLRGIVHGTDDLRSVRVGAVAGTASIDYLNQERIRFRTYATPQAGLSAIKDGSLDAFVYDRPLLAWLAKQQFSAFVDVLDATFDKQTYAIALPNHSALRVPIDLALLGLIHSQWWQDLNQEYFGSS